MSTQLRATVASHSITLVAIVLHPTRVFLNRPTYADDCCHFHLHLQQQPAAPRVQLACTYQMEKLKVPDLKGVLRAMGLHVSGRKGDLLSRLRYIHLPQD